MGSLVIALAGQARSGKTTIAEELGRRMRLNVTRFSDEIAREAISRGLPLHPPATRRASLMELGAELVADDVRGLTERVLQAGGWRPGGSIIVDGIRHVSAARALQDLVAPVPFLLVLVSAPDDVRQARLQAEGIGGAAILKSMNAHSTERELADALPAMAHITVSGTADLIEAVEQIAGDVRARGWER